jgi:hypothetical protein
MSDIQQISTPEFSSFDTVRGKFLNRTKGDKVIWAIVILLTLVSILVVYSSIGSLAYKMNKSTESYLVQADRFHRTGRTYHLFCTQSELHHIFKGGNDFIPIIDPTLILHFKIWQQY